MAWIHPYPSVHHPSVHPYAMAVGSIRREGHGANGTRDGGPYTTMAHTTASTTTTYGCEHHHADTAMHPHSSWRYCGHQLTPPIPLTPVLVYPYSPLASMLSMGTSKATGRRLCSGRPWLRGYGTVSYVLYPVALYYNTLAHHVAQPYDAHHGHEGQCAQGLSQLEIL